MAPIQCLHAAWLAPFTPPRWRVPECSAAQTRAALCFSWMTVVSLPSLNVDLLPSFWEVSTPCNQGVSSASQSHLKLRWTMNPAWTIHIPSVDEIQALCPLRPSWKCSEGTAYEYWAWQLSIMWGFVLYYLEFWHLFPCSCLLNETFKVIYERSGPTRAQGSVLYGSLELLLILTFSLATFRQRICQYLGLWVLQLIFICIISLSRNVKVILN